MAILDELFQGNFRGAKFLIVSATTTGGRKQVKHEYPNSDKQKIEDLGFQPRNFKISAVIAGNPEDDSYLRAKDELLQVLEQEGTGTLSHPFFSNSLEVVARNYTIKEDTRSLGRPTIEMEFDFSDEETNPIATDISLSLVNQSVQNVGSSLISDIISDFGVNFPVNVEPAVNVLNQFLGVSEVATSSFAQVAYAANEYNARIEDFESDIGVFLQDSQSLGNSFIGVVEASTALYETFDEGLQVFSRFYDFGETEDTDGNTRIDNPIPLTTIPRIERHRNNRIIAQATQCAYLTASYQFAAEKQYTTVREINEIQQSLETQYQKIVNSNSIDFGAPDVDSEIIIPPTLDERSQGSTLTNNILSARTLAELNNLRVNVDRFLEVQRLNAAQVVPLKVKTKPLAVTAFSLYGAADNLEELTETLVDLNRPLSNDVSFVGGEIEVVTV